MIRRVALPILLVAFCVGVGAAPAQASRGLQSKALLQMSPEHPLPPPEAQIEGACGLAVSGAALYVADYYHRTVDRFSTSGVYVSQIALPGGAIDGRAINTLDGVCGLAAGPGGALYGNEWHQGVKRLLPSERVFDEAESTGLATDEAGNVYVDERSRVAVYEPSGEPVMEGAEPLLVGEGAIGDGYGVAVSPDGERVYVADAATDTVELFEPASDPSTPVASIAPLGGFASLADASLAVDPSDGHLLVVANTQPGFVHPAAAVYEFDAVGAYLGKLTGSPVFGAPSGIALSTTGTLYVTDGDSEKSNVYLYFPYGGATSAAPASPAAPAAGTSVQSAPEASPAPSPAPATAPAAKPRPAASRTAHASRHRHRHRGGGGRSLVQKGPIRVAVSGGLAPTRLPRAGAAPVNVTVGGLISSTDPSSPPQLRRVSFAFNRAGRLDTEGLPRCRLSDIDPSSTRQALAACRGALVGEGRFAAAVRLPEQSPFPSDGKVLAFNGVLHGKPVVFAHIYGTKPVPTSVVLVLRVHHSRGAFGTRMDASLAGLTGEWGYVRSITLRLGRKFSYQGRRRSYLSAGCPAPKGFPGAVFPLARASFSFAGGKTLSATLTRSCRVR